MRNYFAALGIKKMGETREVTNTCRNTNGLVIPNSVMVTGIKYPLVYLQALTVYLVSKLFNHCNVSDFSSACNFKIDLYIHYPF